MQHVLSMFDRRFAVLLAAAPFLLAAAPAVSAQDPTGGPRVAAEAPALEVSVQSDRRFYRIQDPVLLTLTVSTTKPVEVPGSLLAGKDFDYFLDGKSISTRSTETASVVKLGAGVTMTRRIELDLEPILQGSVEGLPSLTIKLRGLAKEVAGTRSVAVRLVSDQKGLDIAKLDLSKARVRFVTSRGEILFSFFPDKAPGHVKNFIKLSKDGFYNGTRFHRLIHNQILQGGCPNTREGATGESGLGSPGYSINAEFNETRHVRGVLSMARSQGIHTAGSQFFVCLGNMSTLDGKYTAFGQVVQGYQTLDALASTELVRNQFGEQSKPVEPLHLYFAIVEQGDE